MKKRKLLIFIIVFILMIISFSGLSLASSDIVVALDPGHGGNDSGAVGGGLRESDLTWKIASRVKEILDATPGITAVLTKSQYESLDSREERSRRAVANNADLLVSFHINSNDSSTSLSGAEVYITGYKAEKRFNEYSNMLGNDILLNLRNVGVKSFSKYPKVRIGADWDRYPDGSIADYYGIISWPVHMGIPGVLIEHAFINNPYDRANYLNDTMLNKMAEADANAIIKNKELFRREFYGNINTELIDLHYMVANVNQDYIQGYIYIAEWVGNDCRTPTQVPKLTLKSTDGTFSTDLYVSYQDGIKYYFDKNISGLDLNKEYYIEAKLTDTKNLSSEESKTQMVYISDRILKENYKGRTFKVVNNKIVFSEGEYEGKINAKLNNIELTENSSGSTYLSGKVEISEVLENETRTPRAMPEITLRSTDGKVNSKVTVKYEGGINYSFDVNVDNLDRTKSYYFEASLTSEDNIAEEKDKKQLLEIENKEIGKLNGFTVISENNNISITYYGTINTELPQMNIIQNTAGDNYISGKIYIAEWVDGECRTPTTLPEMKLKSTDGTVEKTMYVNHESGIEYYYDINIQRLDVSKEYYIEVTLTDKTNSATEEEKTQVAKFSTNVVNGNLTDGRKVQIVNNNYLKIVDGSLYYGTINTELHDINVIQNAAGDNYISGYIYIAEWVDGNCNTPKEMPEIRLKSTDGEVDLVTYIGYESGIEYYFDKCIEGLDTSKEYYLEVKLQGSNNTADEVSKKQVAKITEQGEIGTCTNGNKVEVEGNIITIKPDLYYGTINTELHDMNIIQNTAGDNYISGYIYIAEWVDGNCNTPKEMPEIRLKSTDGEVDLVTYIGYESGIEYYFDKCIEGLDTNKEYYLEVKLQGSNNTADETSKKQVAKITEQGQIGTCTNGNKVEVKGNIITISDSSLYYGTINTELHDINVIQNTAGDNYISGYIYIAEWVDGNCNTPKEMPEIRLKSTDGEVDLVTYIGYESGIEYYFDKCIEGLDTSKEYYLEVKLQGSNNTADEASKKQVAKITEQGEIGTCTNGNKVKVEGNYITFEKVIRELNLEIETKKQEKENVEENIEKETNELVTNEMKMEKEVETEVEENKEEKEDEGNFQKEQNLITDNSIYNTNTLN